MVNEALWAAQPFNKIRPLQRRHTFGGSIGGRVWIPGVYDGKDRTFFNFNYEKFRESRTGEQRDRPRFLMQAYRDG